MHLSSALRRRERSRRRNALHHSGEGIHEGSAGVLHLRAQWPVGVAGGQGLYGRSCRFLPALWPLTRLGLLEQPPRANTRYVDNPPSRPGALLGILKLGDRGALWDFLDHIAR